MLNSLPTKIALAADATIQLMQDEYENFLPEINRWDWQPGVGLYGLIRAYEVLGEKKYLDYSQYYIDRLLDAQIVSYSINGSMLFEIVLKLFEHSGQERYKQEMFYYLRWLLRSAARCKNGCFEHTWTEPDEHLTEQVWIDTLFMAGIVLADSYRLFDREDTKAEALVQFERHQACLQDSESGLFRHLYEVSSDSHMAGAFWGRGNGWMAASLVDMVRAIGADTPGAAPIVESFQKQMAGARAVQEPDGSFHTILDDPSTYREMSVTAAMGYGALAGVKLNLLDQSFIDVGERALEVVVGNIAENGVVQNVSGGTSGFIAYEDYNQIPISPRLYGQALAVLLMTEYLKK
jgi:unsaturated rhamnogalacturonyl hydrolase